MATMIPRVPLDDIEHGSERDVYRSLRDGLDDDHVVLHSYPWLRPRQGHRAPLAEGEADFVIIHPRRGLLVLEVKGGDLVHQELQWYRRTASGLQTIRNPFEQGRRNMHALVNWVAERSGRRLAKGAFVYGYAVCFPHCAFTGPMPADADRAIILGLPEMNNISSGVQRAFRAWTAQERPMSGERFTRLKETLLPRFSVYRPIGPRIDRAEQSLFELTDEQMRLFRGMYRVQRALVEGAAGSGKTLLALDRALHFARTGAKTLLVCYNRELASWLHERVRSDPSCHDCRDELEIWNFHRLAKTVADRAGIDYAIPSGRDARLFWDREMPERLDQAAEVLDGRGTPWRYDAIVVDEGQDFSELWWYTLLQSLLARDDAPFFVFRDRAQSLRESSADPPVDLVPFDLTRNCRNTRRIAETCAHLIAREADVIARAPRGIEPRIVQAASAVEQRDHVVAELGQLLGKETLSPGRIVLFGPSAKEKSCLAGLDEVAGTPLVSSAEAWRAGDGVLVTTSRSFKGLEADAVIVYDLGGFGRLFTRTDLYVACTRAKHLLIAIVHDREFQRLLHDAAREPSR